MTTVRARGAAGALALGLLVSTMAGAARATTFSVAGINNTGVTASVDFTYAPASATAGTVTIMVTNTTPTPVPGGAFTGLAFNVPTNVTGISNFSFSSTDPQAAGFTAFLNPDMVNAGSLGNFDLGITNDASSSASSKSFLKAQSSYNRAAGRVSALQLALQNATSDRAKAKIQAALDRALGQMNSAMSAMAQNGAGGNSINGGSPSIGVDPTLKATFTIDLIGSGLDTLNAGSFLSLLSVPPPAGSCCKTFVVRFQGVNSQNGTSDFAVPERPPQNVPEPASMLLLGAGVVGLTRALRRR